MSQFHCWVVGVWYVRIKSVAGDFWWTGRWISIINNAGCKEFSAVLGSDKIVKLTWEMRDIGVPNLFQNMVDFSRP